MTGYFSAAGDKNYCESCEEELDFDWQMVLCGDHEERWCSLCIDAASFICDGCLEYVSDHDFHAIDGNAYCEECYEKEKLKEMGGEFYVGNNNEI